MAEPNLLNDEHPSNKDGEKVEKPIVGESDEPGSNIKTQMSPSSAKGALSKLILRDHNNKKRTQEPDQLALNLNATGHSGHDEVDKYDIECVQFNEGFYGAKKSDVEVNLSTEDLILEPRNPSGSIEVEAIDKNRPNVMKRLSNMFPPCSQDSNESNKVFSSPENIRLNSDVNNKNIDMASAIYSENAVTKEDNLSYQGYTVRTEGADLCINSIIFNSDGKKLRIVINTAEYEQFYRGTLSRIKSQPKIILDEDKWTMLYGSYDDDGLGIVEIEVPPGISVGEIQCEGPHQGLIIIDVPRNEPCS